MHCIYTACMNKTPFSFPAMPSFEEIERKAKERHEQAKLAVNESGRFIAVSLGAWIKFAQAAGIEAVHATRIADIPRDTLLRVEEPEPGDEEIWRDYREAFNTLASDRMTRWDACSSSDLKVAMGSAGASKKTRLKAGRDAYPCPRIYDLHYEYPADSIPVWSRPWVDAMEVDGYPVEFRVFVLESKVIGVASYYPQRDLPDTEEILGYADQCKTLAEKLVSYLDDSGDRPWLKSFEEKFDPQTVNATMDFLVTQEGRVLFLEGGPPYGAGAHPCAFVDREISGVALKLAPGVLLR
jgi:hypothetical protein